MKALKLLPLVALAAFFAQPRIRRLANRELRLDFDVHTDSFILVSSGSGTGTLLCYDSAHALVSKSGVAISISGIGPGIGQFDISGVAGSIGIQDPRQIEGNYEIVDANGGAGGAVGASLGFKSQSSGLSFQGAVNDGTGWGVKLNGSLWTIKLAN